MQGNTYTLKLLACVTLHMNVINLFEPKCNFIQTKPGREFINLATLVHTRIRNRLILVSLLKQQRMAVEEVREGIHFVHVLVQSKPKKEN